jgi:hypothetical protein
LDGFDEEYEREMAEAQRRARAQGRGDVLDYLALKSANDSLRARGVELLLAAFTALAGELNRGGAGVALARTDPHRFRVGHSTMVGPRLTFSRGLRSLTVEAGWPRSPRDGVVRGGGLASARVSHFGNSYCYLPATARAGSSSPTRARAPSCTKRTCAATSSDSSNE